MEPCSLKHFNQEMFELYQFKHYKCFENNYTIGGNWGGNI